MKAQAAVQEFSIKTDDIIFLDVGASTGGFTDFLISSGAKKAVCVDVGTDQLHEKLRVDDRVEFYEETDIRDFETQISFDLIIVDVSFISLKVILEKLIQLSHERTEFVFLIKPQFEAGKKYLNKHGVVAEEFHPQILDELKKEFKDSGLLTKGLISSPIKGKNGNQEYLIHLKKVALCKTYVSFVVLHRETLTSL